MMSEEQIHNAERQKELQSLPLERKISITQTRILEWVNKWGSDHVHVSFSGGKDSTVLLDLVRRVNPTIPAVYCDTGLEYPEIKRFVTSQDNVTIVRPKMVFSEVISTYGYPIISKEVAEAIYYARRITSAERERERERKREQSTVNAKNLWVNDSMGCPSPISRGVFSETGDTQFRNWRRKCLLATGSFSGKSMFNKSKWLPVARELPVQISHYCCQVMKKSPLKIYERENKSHPILGTMADESRFRKQAWIRHGCNAFDSKHPTSQPMSFWKEEDVLEYLRMTGIPYASVYGKLEDNPCLHCTGVQRSGCVYCGFGAHQERREDSRFLKLADSHPRLYEYSIGGGQWADNPAYDPVASMEPDEMGWINWNPKKIWVPSKKGLGMGKVFDMINEMYGKEMYKYK